MKRKPNFWFLTLLLALSLHGYAQETTTQRTDVDVNHVNNLRWTALLEAIVLSDGGLNQQQIVQLLVDHGANVNISDKDGVTPVRHARERGFVEIER